MPVDFIQNALHIRLDSGEHRVAPIGRDENILGPVDFGWKTYKDDPDVFTFGEGLLAASAIPGSRRLVFCAYSDQWEGFYISSLGGAAHTFKHVGVNYVALKGRAPEPSVLLLNNRGDGPEVRIEPVADYAELWAGYDKDGETLIGIQALQQALLDRFGGDYNPRRVRVMVVGPAAAHTPEGAIGSNTIKKGEMTPVVDWAGRGGMGSRLFRKHNIVGIMVGGDYMPPDAGLKTKELNPWFIEHFGDKMTKVDMAGTKKYHFDPAIGTGGTFGANNHNLKDLMMTFNYRSVNHEKSERAVLHEKFIAGHYLAQFNEETIKPKNFDHCGEPCSVACKKLFEDYKKDYEPYHALGPQCGIFDQRAAELLNHHADAMGFDAIQIGGFLAWIMECVAEGLIEPEEYGFPPRDQLKFDDILGDIEKFDVVADSLINARYAVALIDAILFDEKAEIFRRGYRGAAEALLKAGNEEAFHRAVYLPNGARGCMVPNQYWTPGMLSPMPIMGKYYVYYGTDFLPPDDLARKNVERMVYEMVSDNCGQCRFHRAWAESLLPVIVNDRFGLDIDFREHHFLLAREIYQHQGHKALPWPTRRIAEIMKGYLEQVAQRGRSTEDVFVWPLRLEDDADILEEMEGYWYAIRSGIERAFRLGPETIGRALTPKQQRERYAVQ